MAVVVAPSGGMAAGLPEVGSGDAGGLEGEEMREKRESQREHRGREQKIKKVGQLLRKIEGGEFEWERQTRVRVIWEGG